MRLIITLNWPPFKVKSGQWWEKVQSHGEGAVQASVWEAGFLPLAALGVLKTPLSSLEAHRVTPAKFWSWSFPSFPGGLWESHK